MGEQGEEPDPAFGNAQPRGGAVLWQHEPVHDDATRGVACCDLVNRGAAFADGKIYFATLDNHLVAVDATTGRQVFDTKLGDINQGETITMAPIVVRGLVLVGNAGGELGVRGWLAAVDGQTGAIAWRAYSTGPDAECLIGPNFHPFYASDRGRDLGVASWPPDKWRNGGGTVWGWLSYDPELDLVYYGTANPGPWNADMRPGDNKWTAGIFARRPARARRSGFTSGRHMTCGTTTASTNRSCSTSTRAAIAARCWFTPNAMATSTCSTGPPARCCRLIRTFTSPRRAASI